MTRFRKQRRGLSMVEVVVAIALLGVGIAACVACIGSATAASQRAEEFTAVQLLAREKLAELELRGAPSGEDQGDFGEQRPGYGWRTVVSDADVRGLSLLRLTVLWGNPDQPRTAEFTTYVRKKNTARRAVDSPCNGCHNSRSASGLSSDELLRVLASSRVSSARIALAIP